MLIFKEDMKICAYFKVQQALTFKMEKDCKIHMRYFPYALINGVRLFMDVYSMVSTNSV